MLDEALTAQPENSILLAASAEIKLQLGDTTGALERAIAATRADPDDCDAYVVLAEAYLGKLDYENCGQAAAKALALDATSASAYEFLSRNRWWKRLYGEAIDILVLGTKNVPYSEMLWIRLGEKQMALRKLSAAEKSFRNALDIKPNLEYAILQIAKILLMQGRHAEALGELDKRSATESHQFRFLRAKALAGKGKSDEAVKILRDLARKPETEIEARIVLSKVYEAKSELEAALSQAQQAASRSDRADPQMAGRAFGRLATVLLRSGQIDDADGASAEAIDRAPESPEVMLARALVLAEKGQPGEAKTLALDARKLNPFMPEVYLTLGEIAIKAKVPSLAANYWQTALYLDPRNEGLCWRLGEVYRTGVRDAALARLYYTMCANLKGKHSTNAEEMLRRMHKEPDLDQE